MSFEKKVEFHNRKIDEMNELAEMSAEETETRRQQFVRQALRRNEGISAEREKFIEGLRTGSPKVLPPNKEG